MNYVSGAGAYYYPIRTTYQRTGTDGPTEGGNYDFMTDETAAYGISEMVSMGKLFYPDGRRYAGEVLHQYGRSIAHGTGIMTWPGQGGKRMCTGNWKYDVPAGEMVLLHWDGTEYKGELNTRYQPSGKGIMRFPDGFSEVSREGYWQAGTLIGKAKVIYGP
jgi:hypothetical protein